MGYFFFHNVIPFSVATYSIFKTILTLALMSTLTLRVRADMISIVPFVYPYVHVFLINIIIIIN